MKKIYYAIENRRVYKELRDKKTGLILNFKVIYNGKTKKDCEEWLKKKVLK